MNIQKFAEYTIFIRPKRTDMRKRGSTLPMLVQQEMEMNPFDKCLFLFCGKTRKILKVLVWDRNGFWECTKWLEEGTFCWPEDEREAMQVTTQQVYGMLKGANPWRELPNLQPQQVC